MKNLITLLLILYLRIKHTNSSCVVENIACLKNATQSSIFEQYSASRAVNGQFQTNEFSHTGSYDPNPWLMVDLANLYYLEKVILLGRSDCCFYRLDYFIVGYSKTNDPPVRGSYNLCGQWSGKALVNYNMTVYCSYQLQPARYIIVQQGLGGPGGLNICELQAFGTNLTSSCPVGLYGSGCKEVCHCLNGLPCSAVGLCEAGCQQDWSGDHCDIYSAISYTSIGCFDDSNNLTNIQLTIENLTTAKCVQYCLQQGFVFAATSNGILCHCGNQTGKDWETQANKTKCTISCSGNATEMCGGVEGYKNVLGVCPPNYFGYKCRFKCHCSDDSTCRYPDGNCVLKNNDTNNIFGYCKKSNGLQTSYWLPPTCHIRDCATNKTCNINGICKYTNLTSNNINIWFCECKKGFNMTEEESCTDIDECKNPNDCDSVTEYCTNTIGSYLCTCKMGYMFNNNKCIDINECLLNNTSCTQNETCINTIGSYSCNLINDFNENNAIKVSLIAGLVVGLFLLLLLILLILCLVFKFRKNCIKTKSNEHSREIKVENKTDVNDSELNDTNNYSTINDENTYDELQTQNTYATTNERIKMDDLGDTHIYASIDNNFKTEFKALPIKPLRSIEYARNATNRRKNRIKNIIPYDDNRIKLKIKNDDPLSDYINASIITAPDESMLIATQVPTTDSINDFWRMVVEYNICVIAMICKFKEIRKCDLYWPFNGSQSYGEVEVQNESETNWVNFTRRVFTVKQGTGETKTLIHYQYTSWPDHGVPDEVYSLLTFRTMFRKDLADSIGMTAVHCSDGAGRTGTFIAINFLLEAHKQKKELKVFDCVNNMRNERQLMVETMEQYQFIYTAVSTEIENGPTLYTVAQFKKLFLNLELVLKKYIRNQYLALSFPNEKLKNTRLMKNENITNLFSDIIFYFNDKLNKQDWVDDIINESTKIILIANSEDSKHFLPKENQSINTSNTSLSLVMSSETTYGFKIQLKLTNLKNSTYKNIQSDVNTNNNLIKVHHILNKNNFSLKTWKSFFDDILKKEKEISIYSKDTEYASLLIAVTYILATLKERKYVCIFSIFQNLFANYKDFNINEALYFDIHKFVLEYLNQ